MESAEPSSSAAAALGPTVDLFVTEDAEVLSGAAGLESVEGLAHFISSSVLHTSAAPSLRGLEEAVRLWDALPANAECGFFQVVLPNVVWAGTRGEWRRSSVPLMPSGVVGSLSLTAGEAAYVLAHSFFLNLKSQTPQKGRYGYLSWGGLYAEPHTLSVQRLLCWFAYWAQIKVVLEGEGYGGAQRGVVFERCQLKQSKAPKWLELQEKVACDNVRLHLGRMEGKGDVFVDFANRDLQIGKIIPSLTQEEVLFSACPECFLVLIFVDRLANNEVFLMRNVVRVAEYKGYSIRFHYAGFFKPDTPKDAVEQVLAMDAVYGQHFSQQSILRDINKAYNGFSQFPGKTVSTGHFGCGAFGGEKSAKFVQQVLAAQLAGVTLVYSAYSDQKWMKKLQHIQQLLQQHKPTVAQCVQFMIEAKPPRSQFYEQLVARLEALPEEETDEAKTSEDVASLV